MRIRQGFLCWSTSSTRKANDTDIFSELFNNSIKTKFNKISRVLQATDKKCYELWICPFLLFIPENETNFKVYDDYPSLEGKIKIKYSTPHDLCHHVSPQIWRTRPRKPLRMEGNLLWFPFVLCHQIIGKRGKRGKWL